VSMTAERIRIERLDGGLVLLSLDRPPANALNAQVLEELEPKLDGLVAEGKTGVLEGYIGLPLWFPQELGLKMLLTIISIAGGTE